jgi:hypothetical protein
MVGCSNKSTTKTAKPIKASKTQAGRRKPSGSSYAWPSRPPPERLAAINPLVGEWQPQSASSVPLGQHQGDRCHARTIDAGNKYISGDYIAGELPADRHA